MDNAMQLKSGLIHAGRQRLAEAGSSVDHAPDARARWPQAMQHGPGITQSQRSLWRESPLTVPGGARLS